MEYSEKARPVVELMEKLAKYERKAQNGGANIATYKAKVYQYKKELERLGAMRGGAGTLPSDVTDLETAVSDTKSNVDNLVTSAEQLIAEVKDYQESYLNIQTMFNRLVTDSTLDTNEIKRRAQAMIADINSYRAKLSNVGMPPGTPDGILQKISNLRTNMVDINDIISHSYINESTNCTKDNGGTQEFDPIKATKLVKNMCKEIRYNLTLKTNVIQKMNLYQTGTATPLQIECVKNVANLFQLVHDGSAIAAPKYIDITSDPTSITAYSTLSAADITELFS
jgi:hypothetical protein